MLIAAAADGTIVPVAIASFTINSFVESIITSHL